MSTASSAILAVVTALAWIALSCTAFTATEEIFSRYEASASDSVAALNLFSRPLASIAATFNLSLSTASSASLAVATAPSNILFAVTAESFILASSTDAAARACAFTAPSATCCAVTSGISIPASTVSAETYGVRRLVRPEPSP